MNIEEIVELLTSNNNTVRTYSKMEFVRFVLDVCIGLIKIGQKDTFRVLVFKQDSEDIVIGLKSSTSIEISIGADEAMDAQAFSLKNGAPKAMGHLMKVLRKADESHIRLQFIPGTLEKDRFYESYLIEDDDFCMDIKFI